MNEQFEMVTFRMALVFTVQESCTKKLWLVIFKIQWGIEIHEILGYVSKTKQPNSNGIKVTHSSSFMDGANIFLEKCAERNVRAEKQTL